MQARGHNGGVHCLAATERPPSEPRGERDFVLSGGADFTIVMWSDAGKLRRQYHGHAGAVRAVLVLGMSIWSCSDDSSVRVWDAAYGVFGLETAPCRATLTGHVGAVHALLLHSGGMLSCGADGAVRCWAIGGSAELRGELRALDVRAAPRRSLPRSRLLRWVAGQLWPLDLR